jgi:hypothetical protein
MFQAFEIKVKLTIEILAVKQIAYYIKNTAYLYNYWYFVMATCFGLSLEHLQATILK